jgi:tetratricopeptide (TPR) repeat protein
MNSGTITITMPSLRIERTLSRTSGTAGHMDRRMMLKTIVLAGVFLALTVTGGCRKQEKDAAGPGQHASERAAAEQSRTPYYYGLIEEYQSVLAGDPHNLAAIIALGNAYYDAGQWKQAVRHYEQALMLDPANADVITDMGTCYRNLGSPDRAIAEYERALKRDPMHQNTLFNLGVVHGYDRKEYATAIRYWEQLLHVSPKHPRADYLQANIAQFKKAMRQQTR